LAAEGAEDWVRSTRWITSEAAAVVDVVVHVHVHDDDYDGPVEFEGVRPRISDPNLCALCG
jgi:hypothetical protein